MARYFLCVVIALLLPLSLFAQDSGNKDSGNKNENFDVRSSVGDLHIGADADARKAGLDLYRDKLKRYGNVLECHSKKHSGDDVDIGGDDSKNSDSKQDSKNKELKCDGDNSGPVTELKVGTEDNQHGVAVEPRDGGKGTAFALVYVYTRGKRGDI